VAALEGGERDTGIDRAAMQEISHYWESVRRLYAPFESDIRAGTADVYRHEMPGGQYTNLREQARALGLEQRWPAVAQAYAEVNRLFGDIVKVTPTSKVVGDLALFMVANDLSADDVLDPARVIAFPESVVSLFRGELGFPPDGFPQALSRKVLDCDGAHPLLPEPPAPYPQDELTYLGNVFNARARAFYARHGVSVIEDAYECNREAGQVSLMITRHCLRYSFNLCPKQVKGIRPDPMTLVNGNEKLTLRFDCRRCEMHVEGKLRKHRSIPILAQ
jgi:pyruvate carboxylase